MSVYTVLLLVYQTDKVNLNRKLIFAVLKYRLAFSDQRHSKGKAISVDNVCNEFVSICLIKL